MEIPSQQSDVRIGGDFQKSSFKIAQTKHTFWILSSGLYSDKERAIVRELACNAWDAHVEAGKQDTPFIIYLPNRIEPFFKVRDFGTGLSHDRMMNPDDGVYTTYFASTKQNSNDQIGCFGLGSKSPFAYTKNFTVVSFFGGEKRTYNMIINDAGLPDAILVATEVTDEPNGLEVSFAVKSGDQWEFKAAARKVLRPFATLPEVKGISNFEPGQEPEALIAKDNWKIFRTHEMPDGMPDQCAVMGNVEYPLSAQKGFSHNAKVVLNMPIRITFPIGSFEVTPSRELVSWTDYSKQNINQILEDIYEEVVKHINDQISGAPNLWEARQQSWKLLHYSVLSKLKIQPKWRGMLVTPTVKVPEGCVVLKMEATRIIRKGVFSISCKTGRVSTIDTVKTEFFLSDFKSAQYRTSSYVRDLDEGKHVYLIEASKKKALKALLKAIGISGKDVRLASSIPKKVRTGTGGSGVGGRRSRLAGSRARAYVLNDNLHGYADNCWNEKEVEMSDGGVYVQIHRYKVVSATGHATDYAMEPASLEGILASLKLLTGTDLEIIGVKTAKVAKFENDEDWITLQEHIQKEVLKVWLNDKDLRAAYQLFQVYRSNDVEEEARQVHVRILKGAREKVHDVLVKKEGYDKAFPESPLIRFFAIVGRVTSKAKRAQAVESLKSWFDESYSLVSHYKGMKEPDYRGILIKHYPLLAIAEGRSGYYGGHGLWEKSKKMVMIRDYIKFMDGLRAQGVQV